MHMVGSFSRAMGYWMQEKCKIVDSAPLEEEIIEEPVAFEAVAVETKQSINLDSSEPTS